MKYPTRNDNGITNTMFNIGQNPNPIAAVAEPLDHTNICKCMRKSNRNTIVAAHKAP